MKYKDDPYWTKARFTSTCTRCKCSIPKQADIFYYPRGKSVYCDKETCGKAESQSFNAAAFDESMYNGKW